MEDPEGFFTGIVALIGCVILFVLCTKSLNKDAKQREKKLTPSVYPEGFTCTRQMNAWHIDDTHKKVCVLMADLKSTTTFAFSQIKDVQIIQSVESRRSGRPVARAIVGGILAGGVGAVIGGISGNSEKDFCTDLRMRVTLINNKNIDEIFLSSATKMSSLTYSLACTNCKNYYNTFYEIYLIGHPKIREKMQQNENGVHEDLTQGL